MYDNYDLWEMHETEKERELARLPKCSCCGEPIKEETCIEVNGELICHGCIETYFTVWVDDYMEG